MMKKMPETESCAHGRSHILDSRFHGGGYATSVSRKIFCDQCRLQRWLDVEVALALSQAELGIIPKAAALEIKRVAEVSKLNLTKIKEGIIRTGHSLVPLLNEVQARCENDAGEFIHFGVTTQDIQDTAQSLELREVLDEVDLGLEKLLNRLTHLAIIHRKSVMTARTHSQPAMPTTFGLKVAGWIDELMRHEERLTQARHRILVVQLFGGVGTMAAFGNKGLDLIKIFADRLSLGVPIVSWHATRDRIAEFVTDLAMLAGSLARIADEIRTLNRPEIHEVEIAWNKDQIGSSTMPHKRNPEQCEQVVAVARLARAQVGIALEGMVVEHERDYRGTRMEWCCVTDVSHFTLAALEASNEIIEGVKIKTKSMLENARAFSEALCTEALVFKLAKTMGKDTAYRLMHTLSQKSQTEHKSLRITIASNMKIRAALHDEELTRLFDPRAYSGMAEKLVDLVVHNPALAKKAGAPVFFRSHAQPHQPMRGQAPKYEDGSKRSLSDAAS